MHCLKPVEDFFTVVTLPKYVLPSSDAKFKNLSETNSCFFISRNVVQNEPSLDSGRKVVNVAKLYILISNICM